MLPIIFSSVGFIMGCIALALGLYSRSVIRRLQMKQQRTIYDSSVSHGGCMRIIEQKDRMIHELAIDRDKWRAEADKWRELWKEGYENGA